VEVELGCGDAAFLIGRAQRHPDRLFLGLDIREKFLLPARAEVERLGLENLQLEISNLIVDSDRLFPPRRVHRFYVNFPDPWFKRRHQNRRWLTSESVGQLAASLVRGGEVFFQSDVWTLALEALALLEGCALLANTRDEWTFLRENPFKSQSSRERDCLAAGLPVWRMLFARSD
jgi:tRNA (guanine-N7-)-methyltransferase